jgi:membrane-associated phospholipid phosphatase
MGTFVESFNDNVYLYFWFDRAALIYDIMVVSFVKAVTRRNRPVGNRSEEMFMAKGPDKFSFPSGHATRAVLVAFLFTQYAFPEMSILFQILLYVWAAAVCISRVLLRRHHVLDVAAGIGIGFLEFLLTGILWVGPTAAKALGDWMASSAEDEYN